MHILTSFETATTTQFGNAIHDVSGTADGCMPASQGIKMVSFFRLFWRTPSPEFVGFFLNKIFFQMSLLNSKKQLQLLASI